MIFSTPFLLSFFSVYLRAAVLVFASSLFGKFIPRRIKLGFIAVFALALSPIIQTYIPLSVTDNYFSFAAFFFNDILIGLTLGFMIQLFFTIYQIAGSVMDLQVGLGNAQILDPLTRVQTSIIGQLKMMLGMILFFIVGGHHHLFKAFIKSYSLELKEDKTILQLINGIIIFFGEAFAFALQIAAPIIAITFILDIIAGIVNKAVPQMQVFFVTIPLKLVIGFFMLILLLPYMAGTVQLNVERTFRHIYSLWDKIDGNKG